MENKANLREYIDILKRQKSIVIIILFLSISIGTYITYRHRVNYVPQYSSIITIRINTMKSNNINSNEETDISEYTANAITLNENITTNYTSLLETSNIKELIAKSLKIPTNKVGIIEASIREEMPDFIDIEVINNNSTLAQKVAQTSPEIFNKELERLVGLDCVEIVYEATSPTLVERGIDFTILICLGIGILLCMIIILISDNFDRKIITTEDIEKYWDYPLVGVIPLDKSILKGKKLKSEEITAK